MHIKKHIVQYCLLLVTLVCGLIAQNNLKKTDAYGTPFVSDVDQYYSILPSAFLYSDIAYAYDSAGNWNKYYDAGTFGTRYWTTEYINGRRMTMATLGMPYAYSFFFIPAAIVDSFLDSREYAPGYSPVYTFFAKLFNLLLALLTITLFFCIARRYVSELLSAILSVILFFGTGTLYYFFGEGLMPHATLTTLISAFILSSLRLLQDGKKQYLPLLAFLIAWIGLIRPTDVLVVIFPLLLLIKSSARQHLLQSLSSIKRIVLSLVLVAILVLPQLLYWKYITGSYLLYSYKEETFHFTQWHLMDFWFSARKGWFVYTPICIIAMLFPVFRKKRMKLEHAAVIILCIVLSLIYAQWWCWWYGGSFGMRTMTQFVPFLIIPMTVIAQWNKWAQRGMVITLALLVINNIWLSRSYHLGRIHYDSMTPKTLVDFYTSSGRAFDYYGKLKVPDYKGCRRNGKEYEYISVKTVSDLSSSEEYIGQIETTLRKEHGYLVAKIYHTINIDNMGGVLKVYDPFGNQVFYKQQSFGESSYTSDGKGFNMIEYRFEKYNFENYKAVFFVYNPEGKKVDVQKLELTVY
jgi:hypothetical protein